MRGKPKQSCAEALIRIYTVLACHADICPCQVDVPGHVWRHQRVKWLMVRLLLLQILWKIPQQPQLQVQLAKQCSPSTCSLESSSRRQQP